jgi:hypothetical protein
MAIDRVDSSRLGRQEENGSRVQRQDRVSLGIMSNHVILKGMAKYHFKRPRPASSSRTVSDLRPLSLLPLVEALRVSVSQTELFSLSSDQPLL